MSKPSLKVTSDFTDHFNEIVKTFKNDEVLVGIPEEKTDRKAGEEKTDRKAGEEAPINNATLLAINEFGSPANNIPSRPVMSIGIKRAQPAIEEQFKRMAKEALEGGVSALLQGYERIGIIAANSIKKVINDQDGIKAPSASTLATRKSEGFKGTKALVRTGQMRNAITSVTRKKL